MVVLINSTVVGIDSIIFLALRAVLGGTGDSSRRNLYYRII